MKGLCRAVLVLVVAVLAAFRFSHKLPLRIQEKLYLMVPEPEELAWRLRKIKAPALSEEELRTLERDGVLFIRGLVQGEEVLRKLLAGMIPHVGMPFRANDLNHRSWLYNGAVRALLRDGPLGDVLGQAIGKEDKFVVLNEAPIWGYPVNRIAAPNQWHADARSKTNTLLSIWMVLTDGPVALEFIRGSHIKREELEEACAALVPGGKNNFKAYNGTCINASVASLEKELNMTGPAVFGPDLKAGDAFIFSGHILHRGVRQTNARVAISIRARWNKKRARPGCNYINPLIFPQGSGNNSTLDFNCGPWALFPGFPQFTPWLPANRFTHKMLRYLERR